MRKRRRNGKIIATKNFYYSGTVDSMKAIIFLIIVLSIGAICCMIFLKVRNINIVSGVIAIGVVAEMIAIPLMLESVISTKLGKYKKLTIKSDEIIYTSGWVTKKTTRIPIDLVKSCTKKIGMLQRICDTMDISITTSGDGPEIYFENITQGEEAYQLIRDLTK